MTLPQYIDKIGSGKLATRLGVDESTVSKWKTWAGVPGPENAYKIVNLSMGIITYEDIYEPYFMKESNRQLAFPMQK